MSEMKNALADILSCEICNGKGITDEWANETDFDFEWCECNPHRLIVEDGELI